MMSSVTVAGVSKWFGDTAALDDVSLAVEEGELLALLGPSGCGKTTTLRCIAGLTPVDRGAVQLGERDVTHVPARYRDIGMVFQNYALFPNLSVAENIAFPLEARRWTRPARDARVAELLDLIDLAETATRYPHQLSGGQQQRVALARALAPRPKVLLLDEPLSALDALTRTMLRDEIRRVQLRLGMTAIYVTHDQTEALAIADRIGVMYLGRMVELGTPAEVYHRPLTEIGASFLGSRNLLDLVVDSDGCVRWQGAFAVPTEWRAGTPVRAAFTPESVELGLQGGLPAEVELVSFRGALTRLQLRANGREIAVDLPSPAAAGYRRGSRVSLRVPTARIHVYRADGAAIEVL
jgi:putative spermidine/putrescine transport system ATP-binding protein